jgi:hypothetical protein
VVLGFAVAAPAGTMKRVLLRVVGPGLQALGLAGMLPRAHLALHDSAGRIVATNDGWDAEPRIGTLAENARVSRATPEAMREVGAFALVPGSSDAALIAELPGGVYTVIASGVDSATGIALTELYELDHVEGARLTNLSTRAHVGATNDVAIAGFVIEGRDPVTLLVRGVGPTLSALGVADVLSRAELAVFDAAGKLIARHGGGASRVEAGNPAIAVAFAPGTPQAGRSVGAFALVPGSADASLQVTLPCGVYTAIMSGRDATVGHGLIELYVMP